MPKNKNKNKNKNWKSGNYSSSPLNDDNQDNESTTSSNANNDGSENKDNSIKGGSYIDHRMYDNLAHIHSSPARSRRRGIQSTSAQGNLASRRHTTTSAEYNNKNPPFKKQPSLPLTNRNLQNLLVQNDTNPGTGYSPTDTRSYGSIALDMDQYAKEQRQMTHGWNDPFNEEGDSRSDDGSINSLEFGGSNPPSDHSSDSTSLDDVCFPDYYDRVDGRGDREDSYEWPDLKILEQFVREELDEYADDEKNEDGLGDHFKMDQQMEDQHNVNFQQPLAVSVNGKADDKKKKKKKKKNNNNKQKSSPDETVESTPLLENAQINEIESMSLMNESFRIRPTPIQPWEKSKDRIPTILNNPNDPVRNPKQQTSFKNAKPDGKLCRFTYFREDLNKTIHSPTISGLLADSISNKVAEDTVSLARKWGKNAKDENNEHDEQNEDNFEDESTTLRELFLPNFYSQKASSSSSSASIHGSHHTPTSSGTPVPLTALNEANIGEMNKLGGTSLKGNYLEPSPAPGTIVGSEVHLDCNPFWLDVLDPTEEEMKVLSKTFGIHPLTTEDIFLGETREKVELFKSYYFICFTSFDIVYERRKQRAKEQEKKLNKLQEMYENSNDGNSVFGTQERKSKIWKFFRKLVKGNENKPASNFHTTKESSSNKSRVKKIREGELLPLNMYMIVFKHAVITFHFSPTPHPVNVRRRARLLKDYLTVSSDWICYAIIDDITDSFAPMIESIEEEVNLIEDAILKMHSGDTDSEDDSDDNSSDDESENNHHALNTRNTNNVFYKRKRSKSTVDNSGFSSRYKTYAPLSTKSESKKSSKSSSSKSTSSKILGWKRKGDMLRRIGECRKRVMSVLRLLGSKADVIKGFSKRFSEKLEADNFRNSLGSPKLEIGMYLSDIQDHIVTMVQSLNHYEKLLARFHSNYLAQINIDMTQVNNDTNDVLGKITVLGTIVLPINVVTGLWGMNCIVPGQDYEGLAWFWSIISGMILFSIFAYNYAKRVYGI